MVILHTVNAYLSCMPRQKAQALWREKLAACGYFRDIPKEKVPVAKALGRITSECVYARQSVPHYNGAAMDGIAVRALDTFGASEKSPKKLKVLKPGEPFVEAGCYIVDTGDLMPAGTNAVIMIEDVHMADNTAEIIAAAVPWQHVRIIGEDIVANEIVLPEHHVITPSDIAAALAAGVDCVEVAAKPQVVVIPTGTELVDSANQLKPGAILDVNSYMLCAAVQEWGGLPTRHEIVPDNYEALKQAVTESLRQADMVITNAGTSAGTEDFTSQVLAELGEVLVHGVAIKPGKPVILAICQGKPVIGLPGYPVSAMLTAEMFVKDILFARQYRQMPKPKVMKAVMARKLFSSVGAEEYVRVTLGNVQGKRVAAPLGRGAGTISSLTKAQGITVAPEGSTGFPAGTEVEVRLFGGSDPDDMILSIGSHDLALDILGVFLRRRGHFNLSCANVGSMGGIMAVRNNEAHLAGIHLLDEQTGKYNVSYMSKYLADKPWRLVHLAMREQGLIVAPGNPKRIAGLADLLRPDVELVNRQRGSGTRTLLDYQLAQQGWTGRPINGYEKEVATHMAVAATIAGGAADVGLGIRAAANALGLAFIPIAQEQYDIIFNFAPDDHRGTWIEEIFRSDDFRRQVERLGGYDLTAAGTLIAANKGCD